MTRCERTPFATAKSARRGRVPVHAASRVPLGQMSVTTPEDLHSRGSSPTAPPAHRPPCGTRRRWDRRARRSRSRCVRASGRARRRGPRRSDEGEPRPSRRGRLGRRGAPGLRRRPGRGAEGGLTLTSNVRARGRRVGGMRGGDNKPTGMLGVPVGVIFLFRRIDSRL